MSEFEVKTESKCIVCGKVQRFANPEFVNSKHKFVCEGCFEIVRAEYERTHPGQSLRAKEEEEQ